MASSVNKWIKKHVITKYVMTDCPKQQKCLEVLALILDGESSDEQEKEYFGHLEECWSCFKDYELEKSIRDLLKQRIEKKEIPAGLVEKIKAMIDQPSINE